ncbi:MAG: TA system VapC family ribonuclease toxin [Terracidiphilus sp.]
MTSLFIDLNVWLALSDAGNSHHATAWAWLSRQPDDVRLILSRYTQLGILRLLTNAAVMGDQTLSLRQAWSVYDRWLEDPRVEFYPEPRSLETEFRQATQPFGAEKASKWVGDCWLLAFAQAAGAQLVTFDRALYEFARKHGNSAILPS